MSGGNTTKKYRKPIREIPDNWASRARCPICFQPGVRIIHRYDRPDRIGCPHCWTFFEAEQAGPCIRIVRLSKSLGPSASEIMDRWLRVKEIRAWAHNSIERRSRIPEISVELTDSQVLDRALSLIESGSSPKLIEADLLALGATYYQISETMTRLTNAVENAKIRSLRPWFWIGFIILIAFALIIGIVLSLFI